ncbi:hypothetical protein CCR80_06020 [Rhodothalassium salexigens]|nr:hypothetical protein [Rhodothalassium salexigens]
MPETGPHLARKRRWVYQNNRTQTPAALLKPPAAEWDGLMFEKIGKNLKSFFATLLLAVLIASFAVWGIGDVFGGGAGRTVARVGDTKISAQDFYAEFQRTLRQLQTQADQAIDREQAIQFGLHIRVLSQLVDRAILDNKADDLGLRASDAQVRETIRSFEGLKDATGNFALPLYEAQLQRAGYTIPEFETLIAKDLARTQLIEAVSAARPVPEALSRALFRYRYETRTGQVITVPASAVELDALPDEATLKDRYEANQSAYMTPEYRGVTALFLDPGLLADTDTLSEDELRAAYQQREREYNQPETRDVRILTLGNAAENSAQSAYERIGAGEDFAAVATELTDFSEEELAIGSQSRAELEDTYGPTIAEAVFALDEQGVTAPLQSAFGWHLFQVTAIAPGRTRSFEQVRDDLARDLAMDAARERAYDLSMDVEDRLAAGETLEAIAADLDLPLSSAERISKDGLGADGKLVSTKPSLLPVLDSAFALFPSDDPELIDYADGGYAFVRTDSITEPAPKPFEAVRGQVEDRWRAEERQRLAGLKADELLARLRDGTDPQSLAEEAGGSLVEPRPVTRAERGGDAMTPAIAELLFALDAGQADLARASNGDGYVIVRTLDVTPGDPAAQADSYAALRQQMAAQMTNEQIVLIRDAVRERIEIETYPEVIQRVLDTQGRG